VTARHRRKNHHGLLSYENSKLKKKEENYQEESSLSYYIPPITGKAACNPPSLEKYFSERRNSFASTHQKNQQCGTKYFKKFATVGRVDEDT